MFSLTTTIYTHGDLKFEVDQACMYQKKKEQSFFTFENVLRVTEEIAVLIYNQK